MSIPLSGYEFRGLYPSAESLQDSSGVYAVLTQLDDGKFRVLDVGESATVRSRVENHDRAESWLEHVVNGIHYAVYYTHGLQQSGRMEIEQELRAIYNPPCGER